MLAASTATTGALLRQRMAEESKAVDLDQLIFAGAAQALVVVR